jgi:hypothetical protein
MYFGSATLEMSKILMPSHDDFSVAGAAVEAHESSDREESVDRKSRSPWTLMSFCEPGQLTWATICGFFGVDTS